MVKVYFRKLVTGSLLKIESDDDSIEFSVYRGGLYHISGLLEVDEYIPLNPHDLLEFLSDYELSVGDLFEKLGDE